MTCRPDQGGIACDHHCRCPLERIDDDQHTHAAKTSGGEFERKDPGHKEQADWGTSAQGDPDRTRECPTRPRGRLQGSTTDRGVAASTGSNDRIRRLGMDWEPS